MLDKQLTLGQTFSAIFFRQIFMPDPKNNFFSPQPMFFFWPLEPGKTVFKTKMSGFRPLGPPFSPRNPYILSHFQL